MAVFDPTHGTIRIASRQSQIIELQRQTPFYVIQGDQKISVVKKNTQKYFKQLQSLTIIT
jgi:hypothetical protein